MELKTVVYEFRCWHNGHRYDVCFTINTTVTRVTIKKNQIIVYKAPAEVFQRQINFSDEKWEKEFKVSNTKDELIVGFRHSQKDVNVFVHPQTENSSLEFIVEGSRI